MSIVRAAPSRLEKLYIILAIVYLSDAFVGLFTPIQFGESVPRSPFSILFEICIYAIAAFYIKQQRRPFKQAFSDCYWAFALVCLAAASALWSPDHFYVLRQVIWLALTTAFGTYIGSRLDRDEQVALLQWALTVIALLSVAFVIFQRDIAVTVDTASQAEAWRGVFNEKNILAKTMVLGVLTSGYACLRQKRLSLTNATQAILFLTLLLKSHSATAICALLLILLVSGIYCIYRWRPRAVALLALFVLAVFPFFLLNQGATDLFLELLKRDATFTGRTNIWEAVVPVIGSHPLLGSGFASFWGGTGPPSLSITDAIGWQSPNSHNGYLDLCLDLGLLGLVTFLIGFARRYKIVVGEFCSCASTCVFWPVLYLTFIIFYNLTESTLLLQNSLYWALYVSCLVCSTKELCIQ